MGPQDEQEKRRNFLKTASLGAIALGSSLGQSVSSFAADAPTGPASANDLPWPERGCFGGKAIVGPHRANAEAMLSKEPIMGLPRENTFIYGPLRDADGNIYELVRGLGERPGTNASLLFQDNVGKESLRVNAGLSQAAASSIGYESALRDGTAVWKSKAGILGKAFEITMSADGGIVTWKEEGLLDVTGTLLGPGMQWCVPDREGSELYVSQIYSMKGTCMGRPVRGLLPFDQSYLPEGQFLYSGKDPLFRPKVHHRAWFTWATVYKDGSYEAAHFVLGTDRLGFAVHTNDRHEMMMETDVSGTITTAPEGTYPARIMLRAGGTEWEFLPDPRGRMPDLLGGVTQSTTPQIDGRWRRVGDKREPAIWCSWGEVAPPGRTDYVRVYRS